MFQTYLHRQGLRDTTPEQRQADALPTAADDRSAWVLREPGCSALKRGEDVESKQYLEMSIPMVRMERCRFGSAHSTRTGNTPAVADGAATI